jgi:hypothetical protein
LVRKDNFRPAPHHALGAAPRVGAALDFRRGLADGCGTGNRGMEHLLVLGFTIQIAKAGRSANSNRRTSSHP